MGALLLHQQCWQWGRDIESPHGNLLLSAGFERSRPPEGLPAGSRYVRRQSGAPSISLWGFGLLAASPDAGGIYINRYCFVTRWIENVDDAQAAWRPSVFNDAGPPLTKKQMRISKRLMRFVLTWMAEYEDWVLAQYGLRYRRDSLRGWREPAILPNRLAAEWRRLAWRIPDPPPRQASPIAGWRAL